MSLIIVTAAVLMAVCDSVILSLLIVLIGMVYLVGRLFLAAADSGRM